jgi:hypothetical protein
MKPIFVGYFMFDVLITVVCVGLGLYLLFTIIQGD